MTSRSGATRKRSKAARPETRGGAVVHEHRLANGLRVLLAERHLDPVVAVMVFYGVGSRNEDERTAGASHFLEHMMFKGTQRFGKGEVDRITAELGGQNNAFTGNDHTAYWFEFASDRWERGLELEADRMRHLLVAPGEFDAEREVVLEELAMGEDDPWRTLAREVETTLFGRHPYARPIIGYPDTLKALSRDDLLAHYRRHYRPGNATLVIAGDVKPAAALRKVREHFGGIEDPALPDPPAWTAAPLEPPKGERRVRMRWPDSGRRLALAWSTARVGTDADVALDMAQVLLTSGRSSRLQRALVVDGDLAVSVSASNDTRVDGGAFWLFVDVATGVATDRIEAAVDAELERLRTRLVPVKEWERALRTVRAEEAHEAESISDLAEELGGFAVDADWRLALDDGVRHARLPRDRFRDLCAELLVPERRVVGWCLPESER